MTNFKWFASFVLATTVIPALVAETHCPGNVESLPFHLVNRYQMIVAVSVNHTGPYKFLLDTGTQITIVDPALADELHLNTRGKATVAGAGFETTAAYARIGQLEAGTHTIENQDVVVYDLRRVLAASLEVRGILGEDFLQHFDMLIDNEHSLLCLDDKAELRFRIKGPHVPLLTSSQSTGDPWLPSSLIIAVRLTDGVRPVRLKLDSGTNAAFLYNASQILAVGLFIGASFHGSGADGAIRTYSALPPQNVKIGSLELPGIAFLTLTGAEKNSRTSDFGGLLTLGLFRRVFICHAEHFVVLDSR